MKIIISHGNTKREIHGPFSICGSRKDLKRLKKAISAALNSDEPFPYGWVHVSKVKRHVPMKDTPPVKWDFSTNL